MAFRLGRLVGLACLLIVLLRLGRVLEAAAAAPDWRLVGGAAMLVGGLISAAGIVYHISLPRMAVVHVIGALFVVVRITATSTLAWGFLPGSETLAHSRQGFLRCTGWARTSPAGNAAVWRFT